MGRHPDSLTPHASPRHFLGAELRHWRETRGWSIVDLARQTNVSTEMVQKVERAERTAKTALIAKCDQKLGTGGALGRLLAFITQMEQAAAAEPPPSQRTEPPPSRPTEIVIKVVTEVPTPPTQPASGAGHNGEARIYPFPVRIEAVPHNAST